MRADLVFSYWLFVWFLLYELSCWRGGGGGANAVVNPFVWLCIGLAANCIQLAAMCVYYKNSWRNIALFIFVNVCIKVIPIAVLWNSSYHHVTTVEFLTGLYLFAVYLLWIFVATGGTVQGVASLLQTADSKLRQDRPNSPFIAFVTRFLK